MLSDDELWRCSREELIQHVQKTQHEKLTLLHDHSRKMKDVNQRLQTHLLEIRNLKEINKKLQDDNQELRDLCCFLDDDRQKHKKLSREWQRFGRQTSSVIKTEVANHQTKLHELALELNVMLKDNEELKELVVYLDDERGSGSRDQGDGSSGNSDDHNNTSTTSPHKSMAKASTQPPPINTETMKYIQHLEERIDLLENQLRKQLDKSKTENPWLSTANISQAMKVLEIHNKVEKTPTCGRSASRSSSHSDYAASPRGGSAAASQLYASPQSAAASGQRSSDTVDTLGSHEKTLLRELCNVAWKTLEEKGPANPKSTRPVIPQNSRV